MSATLEDIGDAMNDAPEQYLEKFHQLLKCKESGDVGAITEAREEFSKEFPLLPALWLDWIEDEIERNGDNHEAIEKLFERALNDFQSVDICMCYINWAVEVGMEFALQKMELIACIVGIHPISSSIIWDTFLDVLTFTHESIDESETDAKEKSKTQIIKLFERALKIPQNSIQELYERYVSFVGEENISATIRSNYETSLKIYLEELSEFEDDLANSDNKIEAYSKYIAYETDGDSIPRIQFIYERAIVDLPFSEDLWLQYTTWLDSRKIYSISVYDRACKLCYGCVGLWQQSLLALERNGIEYETLSNVWENAKAAIQTEDECVAVYRTYIYLTHRYLVKSGAVSFVLVEKLFKESLKLIREEFGGYENSSVQLCKNFAYYLYSKSKKPEEARSVVNDIIGVSGDANKAAFWLEIINMERHFGNLAHTRRYLYIAINSVKDDPYSIFGALIQFEREEGTLEELDKALEKVNAQAQRLRQQQVQEKKSKKGQHQGKAKKRQLEKDEGSPAKKTKLLTKDSVGEITQRTQEVSCVDEDGFKKPLLPPPRLKRSNDVTRMDTTTINSQKQTEDDTEMQCDNNVDNAPSGSTFKYSTSMELNKLFVRNVDFKCTEGELKKHFERYGRVESVRIVTHKDGTPKGVAYVVYTNAEEAQKGMQANDTKLCKRKLKVFISDPPPKGEKRRDFVPMAVDVKEESLKPTKHIARASRLSMVPRSLSKNTVMAPTKPTTDTTNGH